MRKPIGIIDKELQEPTPDGSVHWIRFQTVIESVRLAALNGDSLSSRVGILRTLLHEMEEKTPGGPLIAIDPCLAVEGYLALAEVAVRSDSLPDVLKALIAADHTLDVFLRASPEQPRLRSLKARIEVKRGSALAGAGGSGVAMDAAKRAVAIAERLAIEDPSYFYDLGCAWRSSPGSTRPHPARPRPRWRHSARPWRPVSTIFKSSRTTNSSRRSETGKTSRRWYTTRRRDRPLPQEAVMTMSG